MGLLDFLSPAVNVATGAVGAYEGAENNAAKERQARVAQALQQARQQQKDALDQALGQAQIGNYQSEAQDRLFKQQHHPVDPNSPDVLTRKQQLGIEENRQKIKDDKAYGWHAPVMPYEPVPITDPNNPNGGPQTGRFNKATGQVETTGFGKPVAAGKGAGGATQQMVQQHYNSARKADDRLNQFGGTVASHNQFSNFVMGHNPFDSDLQQANQAGEEFATLVAPLVNRGRTTHIELDQIKRSYVPLASDSKATIAQKAASRKELLDAFAQEIGEGSGKLSPEDAARAQQDPGFAAWLKQQGHLP